MRMLILMLSFSAMFALAQSTPTVYLSSKSVGNTWNAYRDQSQEMAKDFAKECRSVRVTTNAGEADYAVSLNHIEVGLFVRDNQIAVTDIFGTVLSTREKGSIRGGVKGACSLIMSDWANPKDMRERLVKAINSSFQKEGIVGYAELSGDKLIVHSERASAMRFRMMVASRELPMLRRAQIATYVYTNDMDQNFELDVKSGQIVPASPQASN